MIFGLTNILPMRVNSNGCNKWEVMVMIMHVAHNGGIVVDPKGNAAVVLGDTTGAFYRDRTVHDTADLFLMTFTQADGSYEPPMMGDVIDDKEDIPQDV
jgi:hypothetical protein